MTNINKGFFIKNLKEIQNIFQSHGLDLENTYIEFGQFDLSDTNPPQPIIYYKTRDSFVTDEHSLKAAFETFCVLNEVTTDAIFTNHPKGNNLSIRVKDVEHDVVEICPKTPYNSTTLVVFNLDLQHLISDEIKKYFLIDSTNHYTSLNLDSDFLIENNTLLSSHLLNLLLKTNPQVEPYITQALETIKQYHTENPTTPRHIRESTPKCPAPPTKQIKAYTMDVDGTRAPIELKSFALPPTTYIPPKDFPTRALSKNAPVRRLFTSVTSDISQNTSNLEKTPAEAPTSLVTQEATQPLIINTTPVETIEPIEILTELQPNTKTEDAKIELSKHGIEYKYNPINRTLVIKATNADIAFTSRQDTYLQFTHKISELLLLSLQQEKIDMLIQKIVFDKIAFTKNNSPQHIFSILASFTTLTNVDFLGAKKHPIIDAETVLTLLDSDIVTKKPNIIPSDLLNKTHRYGHSTPSLEEAISNKANQLLHPGKNRRFEFPMSNSRTPRKLR